MNRQTMAAQWNAVYVDGDWRLLDVFWASTVLVGRRSADWALLESEDDQYEDEQQGSSDGQAVHTVNEYFFLTDPDMLITTHYPDDPRWQLLARPATLQEFEDHVYIRERFFQLGMKLLPESWRKCLLQTVNGEINICFGLNEQQARQMQFKYLLYKQREANETGVNTGTLERFVFFEKSPDKLSYTARFPMSGKFKMDVFGQTRSQEKLELMCSYLIQCHDSQKKVNPLPDNPDIGWGPGMEAEDAGLRAQSHQESVIVTEDGKVEIRFKMDRALSVMQTLKHNKLDEWLLKRFGVVSTEGEDLVIHLRLPASGEFALKLFANEQNQEGDLPNICNYLIKCDEQKLKPQPFPKFHEGLLGQSFLARLLGVQAATHPGGSVSSGSDGRVQVAFTTQGQGEELVCELHSNTVDQSDLSRLVKTENTGIQTTFDVTLPRAGDYAMNVYARRQGQDDRLHHVHTYLLHADSDNPDHQVAAPKEVVPVIPLTVSGSRIDVQVPVGGEGTAKLLAELQRVNAQDGPEVGAVQNLGRKDKFDVMRVSLPHPGEYKMDVFERNSGGGLEHVCTYQITRDDSLAATQTVTH